MRFETTKKERINFASITMKIKELIFSEGYKGRARKREQDFTRKRKMTFTAMISFMINQIKTSTQTALDRFFDLIGIPEEHMSEQSFSEARKKLHWEACRELFDKSAESVYEGGYSTWHGYRALAIDGSKLQLPSDPKLRKIFGTVGRGDIAAAAQSSCLYDVLNGIIIDARMAPMSTDERSLAMTHVGHLCSLPSFSKELVILDRGYPSFELIHFFESKKLSYLMRVKTKFNIDIDHMPLGDRRYFLSQGQERIAVRVIKFHLPSGETETLITNVLDERMGIKAFKKLYFKRWPIETKYGDLKHKLEIENFSGRMEEAVYQDYYITAFLSNMLFIAAAEVQPIIDEIREDKENKYDCQVNVNHAVGVFKDRFIMALLDPDPLRKSQTVEKILRLLKAHVTPVRPNRTVERNPNPRKANFHFNKKSNC